jgi:thiol-disulfide isomerase/thioredoxin
MSARLVLPAALMCLATVGEQQLPAAAQEPEADPFWTENTGLLVCLTECVAFDPHQPGDDEPFPEQATISLTGEVFDSPDFQQMLLLPARWGTAYVLELATGEVLAYAQSALLGDGGALLAPPEGGGSPVGIFVVQGDGAITFPTPECDVAVEAAPPLVGELTRAQLASRQPGYPRRAAIYPPDSASVQMLATVEGRIEIVAFFGTWCSTCKESLSALLKTLDEAGNANIELTLVGMDEDMVEPLELITNFEISDVPTFIVLRDGGEIGRIEEEPQVSMEADLARILAEEQSRQRELRR